MIIRQGEIMQPKRKFRLNKNYTTVTGEKIVLKDYEWHYSTGEHDPSEWYYEIKEGNYKQDDMQTLIPESVLSDMLKNEQL